MADPRAHAFVSYASADRERVMPIVAAMERAGVRVWLDRSGIPGGASYGPEIVAAIRESGALILMSSAPAFSSRNVRQEVALAWKHERPILPLLLERVEVPDDLAYWLEAAQWVEQFGRPEGEWLPSVLVALRRLGVAGDPSPVATAVDQAGSGRARLPTPLTELLGRDAEVRELGRLLADHRLVTLTGPGGVGKTRLAIETARAAAPSFPNGVTFVDLAPVWEPDLVLPTVAQALGLGEPVSSPTPDSLALAIGERRILLLLDNLEQVLEAAAGISVLLILCPGLAVLATSRMPLAVRGERVYPLDPLAVPSAVGGTALPGALASPAVDLFVARAKDARPGFSLTVENAAVVAEICIRLDGLPLAIELAAARVKLLNPQQVLERLEQRLPFLTGGARDLPTRQRTLRDAIAWSYDLLTPDERLLFGRMGIFVGGCDVMSVEAVCNPGGRHDVVGVLESLLDGSLLRLDSAHDEPRYLMLETIREFAVGRLAAGGEHGAVAGRHAAYFGDMVRLAEAPLWTSGALEWMGVFGLETNEANIRAALDWLSSNDPVGHARMAGVLGMYWYEYGHLKEGRRRLEAALANPEGLGIILPPGDHACVLLGYGIILQMQDDLVQAQVAFEEGLARAVESGSPRYVATATCLLGGVLVSRGQYDEAEPLFADAVDAWHGGDYGIWVAHARFHLGLIAFARRDWDRAVDWLKEAVRLDDASGGELEATDPLHYLALIACQRGETATAAGIVVDILERLRRRGSAPALADGLADAATVAAYRGEVDVAARLFGAAARSLEVAGGTHSLPGRETYGEAEAISRQKLTDDGWMTAFTAGHAMSLDQALEEAEEFLSVASADGSMQKANGDQVRDVVSEGD